MLGAKPLDCVPIMLVDDATRRSLFLDDFRVLCCLIETESFQRCRAEVGILSPTHQELAIRQIAGRRSVTTPLNRRGQNRFIYTGPEKGRDGPVLCERRRPDIVADPAGTPFGDLVEQGIEPVVRYPFEVFGNDTLYCLAGSRDGSASQDVARFPSVFGTCLDAVQQIS